MDQYVLGALFDRIVPGAMGVACLVFGVLAVWGFCREVARGLKDAP